MLETVFASLGAAVCVALLVHMFLPARPRQIVDAACARLWRGLRSGWPRRYSGMPKVARRPKPRAAAQRPSPAAVQREAEREAQDVIDRVRRQARANPGVTREGNVLRPDAFKPRPPNDTLH